MTDLMQMDPGWAWSPYEPDGATPWTPSLAAHLFRRAGFGATRDQLAAAVGQSPADIVRQLFDDDAHADFERDAQQLADAMLATGNPQNLAPWWLYRMLHSPAPLREKLTLFWHGHFATGAEKVNDAQDMFAQNQLLREHAWGDFTQLVQGISRDPAMLLYLDSASNRKAHPNENYARELMELFCLGEGNYSESDVQQVARCFTGWEVRRHQFRFNRFQHDQGEKQFLGRSGNFSGEDAVRIVLEQPAAPRFIVRKLFRFFVCDEPDAPDVLLEPLAEQLRADGFQIAPTLQRMLGSRLFFSPLAFARKIRSPVELGVGLLISLEGQTNVQWMASQLANLGQSIFYPPSVKGWDGGRTWINSATLIARANLVLGLVAQENTRFGEVNLDEWASGRGLNSPEAFVDGLAELLLSVPLADAVRGELISIAQGDQRRTAYQQALCALAALPEFQLG